MTNRILTEDNLVQMHIFQKVLPDVRDYIRRHLPPDWPDLRAVLSCVVDYSLGPRPLLPLAGCAAVGGDAHDAVPVAAAWTVIFLSGGILDDLQDKDRDDALWANVGDARAFNFSAALLALSGMLLAEAPWSAGRYWMINRTFHQETMRLMAGQDRDLCGETRTLDDYWRTIGSKTANAFAWACQAGALCGTEDLILIEACRKYGYHLGLALQIFDDFQGLWEPVGLGDLACGKITLPVIFGLSVAHERREELNSLVNSGQMAVAANRVREILDSIHTRDFMVWAALQERERALTALALCPGNAGVTALSAYVTVMFARIECAIRQGNKTAAGQNLPGGA